MSDADTSDVISLEQLLGRASLEHLECSAGFVKVRGMDIAYWRYQVKESERSKYFSEDEAGPPVLSLHGGPSVTHNYIKPIMLLAESGYPVILYDQCGCGKSKNGVDDPAKTPGLEHLLQVEYYVEECLALVEQLGLKSYYIYGSSWGSMLAQEVAITRPKGLLGLILDGTFCDVNVYIQTQWRDRLGTLPSFTQNLVKDLTAKQMYECKAYKALEPVLTTFWTLRVFPTPQVWRDGEEQANLAIYRQMQGFSEFTIGGTLGNWSSKERLHRINVPTLVVRGEYDTMTEEASQQVVDHIKTAWPLVSIPRASHCKLLEEPHLCCSIFSKFLYTCEMTRKRGAD